MRASGIKGEAQAEQLRANSRGGTPMVSTQLPAYASNSTSLQVWLAGLHMLLYLSRQQQHATAAVCSTQVSVLVLSPSGVVLL